MQKGTIVYIGGMEMPDGNAAANRALNNSKIFKSLGFNVVFVGVDKTVKEDCYEPKSFDGFLSFPSVYPTTTKEWIKQLFGFKHLKFVLDKFDDLKFVVCYNMHAKPLYNVLKYCKKRNIKVIADATEWYENKFSFSPVKFIKWLDTNICMTYLQKKVDGMIAISEYLKNYYQGSVKNVIQLPPLVDTKEDIWTCETGKLEETVEFIYAGQPGKDKDDLCLIIDAFCEIKNQNFLFNVVGVTKDEFLKENESVTSSVELIGDKIKFFGRVIHKESVALLRESDYCVFIREKTRKNDAGFPTKFAECVTAGVGVIASDVSNIKDYFPLDNSVLLENVSVENLKDALNGAVRKGKIEKEISKVFDVENYVENMRVFLSKIDK